MSNALRWLAAAALLGLAAQACAGDIYVCKGANGVNSYQNTPCTTPTAELRHGTYDPALARPGVPQATETDAQQMAYSAPPPRAPQTYAENQPSQAPVGYQCTAGRRVWVQAAPCPPTYADSQMVDVDGRTMAGEQVRGTGWMHVDKPVRQQALDRDAFCDQVRSGARIGQGGGSDASQSYERNKLKRNVCGG